MYASIAQHASHQGLTDPAVDLDDTKWQRAVERLREARLLAPTDPAAPDTLDAHPLVREWFGERLRRTNGTAWKTAHGRLYEHLRDTTEEGKTPALEDPHLYQAIGHGCRAGRHQSAHDEIYVGRILRLLPDGEVEFYASKQLGALGSNLATISWFFERVTRRWLKIYQATQADLYLARPLLRGLGRHSEALPAQRTALQLTEVAENWRIAPAVPQIQRGKPPSRRYHRRYCAGTKAVEYAKPQRRQSRIDGRPTLADALYASRTPSRSWRIFSLRPNVGIGNGTRGFRSCIRVQVIGIATCC